MRSGKVEEVVEKKADAIKEYDFSLPKKFTKDQMKSLSNIYENFSRVLSSYFSSILRNVCEVNIVQMEEQRYYEFNNALPDNALVGMVSCKPESPLYDESTVMLEMPTMFGFLLIDRLMGGSEKVYAPERDYTEIEASLLQLVLDKTTKYLQEAWSNFFPMVCALRSLETNGRLLQAYSQQDIVVIITLEVKGDDYSGMVNVCMPAENLELIIGSFSTKYAHASKQQDPERERAKRDMMMDYLKQSDLDLEAVLDICHMSLSDIALLQPNDVIALGKKIDSDIRVNVEGIPWFTARLGEVNSKKALKLVSVIAK